MATYRRVAQGILTWELQKRSGLRVRTESDVVVPGTRVVSGFGVGPFRINAPCEVVWVRRPVPGGGPAVRRVRLRHPAGPSGPRRGSVRGCDRCRGARSLITITAFGGPSNWFYAAGGALTRRARGHITSRYIRSAQELAAGVN